MIIRFDSDKQEFYSFYPCIMVITYKKDHAHFDGWNLERSEKYIHDPIRSFASIADWKRNHSTRVKILTKNEWIDLAQELHVPVSIVRGEVTIL